MGDFGPAIEPGEYWERRAKRFAASGEGLAAVCSYGMPGFYNRAIQHAQRRALAPWLRAKPGQSVLDVGCGVGRWSRHLAHQGARVTGIDLSATMTGEAARRAELEGVGERCRFEVADLARLNMGERYDLITGVTVLQHMLDDGAFRRAIVALAAHLAPGGRMVLLEAAPTRRVQRCDSPIFKARDEAAFLEAFACAGLRVHAVSGVDPAPFKTFYLPWYSRLPGPIARAALAVIVALSWPVDTLLGRRLARASWHKVFVLEHGGNLAA